MFTAYKRLQHSVKLATDYTIACTTRLVDKLHKKSRSHMQKHVHTVQNRTIDAHRTTQPSSRRSQNGTPKRHAHSTNGPGIAAPAHADGGCPKPRSKSSKTKRTMLDQVALNARCKRGRKRSVERGTMRAPTFDYRAQAGGGSLLDISAVILSHQGLQGYGYKVHNPQPAIYIWETGRRKVRNTLIYLCSAPFAGRPGRIRRRRAWP